MSSTKTPSGQSSIAGTSTVVVGNSGGAVNVPQIVYNLTVNPGLSTTVSSAFAFSGTLTLTAASVTFNSDVTSSGASAAALGNSILTVAGSWNTASVAATNFTASLSSVTFSGTAKSITLSAGSSFGSVTITGTLSLGSALTSSALTVSAGGLTKGTNPLSVNGSLVLSGGYLASTSGAVAVSGDVNISSPASYIVFGSEAWTVSGWSPSPIPLSRPVPPPWRPIPP